MATTVDQKVVQMKFDNRDFEQNVKISMSTLDKLKAKLHLDGASKGLEEISATARKVNMNGLADGIQTVSAKFSAMEVIGVTALANITNSAVNAGKQLISSLTVDQVASGWTKMNQKIGSVQTLVNSTGLSVEEIDDYLSELMWFSDETSYSFTDMTQALAQMTSTGGDIKKLVPMITGIANATAFAGKGAAEFSRIIYNLNQSYGAGSLQLMDWKSVQLAGANSKQLTEELIKAGVELGKIKEGQVTIGTFNESLKDKWATTEVMELAFGRFAELSQAAYKAVEAGEFDTASEAIAALAENYDELAVKAFRSAQEAKSFKEAMDATADATSSAWMEIFADILGNYNDQKRIFTDFANWLYNVFVEPIYAVEEVIRNAFDFSGFEAMWNKLSDNSLVKSMTKISEAVKTTSKTLEDYQAVVKQVWRGDFNNVGDNPDRFDLLTKQGWDPRVVQDLVNQTDKLAGAGKGWTAIGQLTIDDVRRSEEKYGVAVASTTDAIEDKTDAAEELNKRLQNLTETELKNLGLSDEEVRMYQSLQRASKKYKKSMDEIIKSMSEMSGRDLVFGKGAVDDADHVPGIFQNIAGALGNIAKAAKTAWAEVFNPFGGAELYMIIHNLWEFTNRLKEASGQEKIVKNLTNVFKGLFGILKLVTTLVGGGFKIAWTIFSTVCKTLGYDVIDVAGAIGELTYRVTNFITNNKWLIDGVAWLTKVIAGVIVKVHDWVTGFISASGIVEKFLKVLDKLKEGFGTWFEGLKKQKGLGNIAKYIFEGFINGVKEYGGKALSAMWNFVTTLITTVKDKLGIHSPSTVFFAIGGFLIAGLLAGLKANSVSLLDFLKGIGSKMIEIFQSIDLSSLFIMASTGGLIYGFVKLSKGIGILAQGIQSINGVLDAGRAVLKSFKGVLDTFKIKIITDSLKSIAIAIGILVAAIVVLYNLKDTGKLWQSIGAIAALMAILVGFAALAGVINKKGFKEFGKLALTILAIGIAMLLVSSALKKIAKIKDLSWNTMAQFGVLILGMLAMIKVLTSNGDAAIKMAATILAIGVLFKIMASVVKSLGKLKGEEITKGLFAITMFGILIVATLGVTNMLSTADKIGGSGSAILKIAAAFLLMGIVVKSMGKLKADQIAKGITVVTLFSGLIVGLMAATRLAAAGADVDKLGGTIAKISIAFVLMAVAVKLVGKMKPGELAKGLVVVAAFTGLIALLIACTRNYAGQVTGVGTMMFGIAAAMAVMALAVGVIGMMKTTNIAKGLVAIGLLTLFVKGLIEATRDSRNIYKTVLAFTALIAVLAIAIGLLSIIDPKKLVAPTAALSMLIGFSALLIKATEGFSKGGNWKQMLANVGIILGFIALLAAIVVGLSFINADNAIKSCAALAILGAAMTAMLYAMGNIKIDLTSLLTSIVGIMAIVVALYGVVGVLTLMAGVPNAQANTIVLIEFMAALTLCLIGIAAAGAIYAISGGLALLGLVGLLGIMVALLSLIGILALMNAVPNATANTLLLINFMTAMVGMLTQLAIVGPLAVIGVTALTGLIGLIGVLIVFATAIGALVTWIPALQQFMTTGMQIMISLAGGLGEMIGAFVNGMLTTVSAGLPAVGQNLSDFITAAMPFITGVKMADGNTLKGVGVLTGAIIALTVAELVNGIGKLLTMGGGLKQLGLDLSAFAINAMPFMAICGTLNADMMKGVESLSKAILTLTKAELIQGIVNFVSGGGSSLQAFGAQLPGLGGNLALFVSALGTFTDAQASTVKCAGDAIVSLADAAKKLPNEGGWVAKILGDNSLATFGKSLPDIGKNIKAFVSELGEFSQPQIDTANCAGKVIVALADAAKKIPNEGGLWAKIFGDNSLAAFSDNLPDVAKGIVGFVNKLGDFGDKTDSVNAAAEVIKAIAAMADTGADKKKGEKLADFTDKLGNFGKKLKEFITTMSSVSKEDSELAKDNANTIVNAAKTMMETLSTSITDKSGDIVSAAKDVAKNAAKGMVDKDVTKEVKNSGKNFVQGFADGIKNNASLAESAARTVAQNALAAGNKALGINSPSKETEEQAGYFCDGFVIGLKKYSTKVYSMSGKMAENAKAGLADTISKISSLVETDLDSNPTIRPVLDLSDVTSNASKIGTLLNGNKLGVSANINSISSGMNAKLQNGNNSDVVSAINKLGKNINENAGNTYNINGINTNGDPAIENAVNVLIRAIEIEGRV